MPSSHFIQEMQAEQISKNYCKFEEEICFIHKISVSLHPLFTLIKGNIIAHVKDLSTYRKVSYGWEQRFSL
jgi:hypothetical protein